MDESQWTLRELIAEVATQLARNYEAADNGQVRAIPDERSVRYYTSIGLLDRPASMRGRTALYGTRHLAQLVAIKRLQALGKSLAEIQQTMTSLDDATLSRVSGVVLPKSSRRAARGGFWKADPDHRQGAKAPSTPRSEPSFDLGDLGALAPWRQLWTLALAPGVTLTFELSRVPGAADALALARAAQPLLDELATRQLAQENER